MTMTHYFFPLLDLNYNLILKKRIIRKQVNEVAIMMSIDTIDDNKKSSGPTTRIAYFCHLVSFK